METRRGIIKSGMGLAAIIAAGEAPAAVRSLIAAHKTNAMMAGGGGWKNPYVTDGLIAMWDGEWNAGPGVHDPNATKIIDLVGGLEMSFASTDYTILDDRIYINGNTSYGVIEGLTIATPCTQEAVILMQNKPTYGRIVGESKGMYVVYDKLGYYFFGREDTSSGTVSQTQICSCSISLSSAGIKEYLNSGICLDVATVISGSSSNTTTIFNRSTGGRAIVGYLFNIRFYSRPLTAEEIAYNYTIDKERFNLND